LGGGYVLIKTFSFGILLGIAAAAAALYLIPAVDQHRESSIVAVAPNGGNSEIFHINIPTDRIMVGGPQQESLPLGLKWPDDPILSSVSAEMFKVRNARDTVIGVAARTAAIEGESTVLDWVIHLPARGSIYVNMNSVAEEGGFRMGEIRAGSRELGSLSGFVSERWVSDTSDDDDAPAGRIELAAMYVGSLETIE
jgi:hypothetical protein